MTRRVAENSPTGAAVGDPVTATDTDTGDTLSYTLEGEDASSFDIGAATGQITTRAEVSYDHEASPSYSVTVKADDGNGGAASVAVAILNDDLTYRVIHMDGRELEADPFPSWMGYSVGRWDGDTLVVDSAGFNDKTWVSRYGVSHTEALRITERYRRPDFGHLQVEVTFTDPGAFAKPWGFTVNMVLAADTDMLEAVCERSSEDWAGSLSDAANRAVSVPPDVLARYVGVYSGIYGGNERTYEVSLSGGQLIATIVGAYDAVGLGAAGLDPGAPPPLVPQSQTLFEGLGLGYRFIVNDEGVATDLMVIHVSGDYRYSRQR